jgi:hypothetical protein
MNFNFNSLSEQNFTSSAGQYLRPYDIYTVNLTKIEKTELKGSKDPNATYPIVALEFTGCGDNKGVFTTNLFIPTSEQDMERPTFKNNEGHEYQRPSRFENFQFTLMQIVHALNPAGEEKIKANASKIKTIDQFIDLIIKALNGKNNIETNLKLVGRKDAKSGVTYAELPRPCGINKSGEIFPVNFIGENLFFTNYELTQQKAYQNAKPTNMDKVESSGDKSADVDLDDIEL